MSSQGEAVEPLESPGGTMSGELAARIEREAFALLPSAVPEAGVEALLAGLTPRLTGAESR